MGRVYVFVCMYAYVYIYNFSKSLKFVHSKYSFVICFFLLHVIFSLYQISFEDILMVV